MDFGHVAQNDLKNIDFTLPADPGLNNKILSQVPVKNSKVYIGCAKWGRKEWVGKIYPPKTREKDFLSHYVQHYNSIELNATHYKIYSSESIAKWAKESAGKDFLFCPKIYNGITHAGSLSGKEKLTAEFLNSMLAFGKNLGPIFIQLSESFSPNRIEELFDFLESLPTDMQFFVEVRHPAWFAKAGIREEFFWRLNQLKMGAVITDASGRRDCAHMYLTLPKAFIRFVGNSLDTTDYKRIDEWINRIKQWLNNGLEEVYFFMHMPDETFSPELTVYLVDKINEICGLSLPKPTFVSQQKTLF
ncbi:MAG: hypothetical protein JWP81_1149 [Ferruginibacter sp.]|nr:hypothetical protein [Ferruginibacter sp.]